MAIREYHAPRILAAVFLVLFLVCGYFAYDGYRLNAASRAQEVQAVKNCEEQYKSDSADVQVSFAGISAERFGGTRIIITGTAVYTSASGQTRTEKMNCNIDMPAIGH